MRLGISIYSAMSRHSSVSD